MTDHLVDPPAPYQEGPAAQPGLAAQPAPSASRRDRSALPLWIAAISLAVIAVVLLVGTIEVVHTMRTARTAIEQLQQQMKQLQQGLGAGLGG